MQLDFFEAFYYLFCNIHWYGYCYPRYDIILRYNVFVVVFPFGELNYIT